ncbi:MAG: hypothetical protein WB760_03480 [Xanthobacteraceae bacterium]
MSAASGPEAIKAMLVTYYPDIATLAAMIAHSQIVVREPPQVVFDHLPGGYEEIDIAILDWIAAEGRRVGRGLALM